MDAFCSCIRLTSVVIPGSVTSIASSAFSGCSSLAEIKVSENNQNFKDIDGNLYSKDGKTLVQYACGKRDTSFTIPNSVETISRYALMGCNSLTEIVIPTSVTSIDEYVFAGCTGLTIYCEATSKPQGWDKNWANGNCNIIWGA